MAIRNGPSRPGSRVRDSGGPAGAATCVGPVADRLP